MYDYIMYYTIKHCYENINIKPYDIEKIDNMRSINSNFVSDLIKNNISSSIKNNKFNYFLIKSNNIKLYIATPNKLNKNLVEDLLKRIHLIKNIIPKQDKGKNIIFIWLTPLKKLLPNNNKILGKNEINSASCDVMKYENGNIYIWRKEEVKKILIHELLHCLNYDSDFFWEDNEKKFWDNYVKNNFNINKYINLNESYTETLTTIINCIINSIETNNSFKDNLKKEQNYSMEQLDKILKYNGFMYVDELEKKNGDKIFPQETSIFSYFIIKSALLHNYENFNKFVIKNGLVFNKNNKNEFVNLINNSFKKLKKKHYQFINKNDINNSLRMTIIN